MSFSWEDWVENGPGDDQALRRFEEQARLRRLKYRDRFHPGVVQKPYLCPVCGGTIYSEPCEWCLEGDSE